MTDAQARYLPESRVGEKLQKYLVAWGTDARAIAPLSGGSRSDVWLIEIGQERLTARRSRRSPAALAWELDLIDYLAVHGVEVPRILPTLDGGRTNGDVVVFSWIEGRTPESERDWCNVADELRRIHQLTTGWLQRPTFASTQELLSQDAGGDVRLAEMPEEVVILCRDTWKQLADQPMSVVHGDPRGNALITETGVAFIDWDEARVDASILDLIDLPFFNDELEGRTRASARRAASAWEASNSWSLEPEYARRRLAELS
jgi:Ser/Thr protein kinase RdoA (MazF antagonist)